MSILDEVRAKPCGPAERTQALAPPSQPNHFLARLNESDRTAIEPHIVSRTFAAGEVLYEPGSDVDAVYLPDGCALSVIKLLRDGRAVETRTIGRESGFGLLHALGSRLCQTRVLVQLPGRCHQIAVKDLARLADASATLRHWLIRHAQVTSAQTEQSVACNVLHSVEQRLARWLLMSRDRTDQHVLGLTHEFLALMLGVQRTSVTAAARRMQDAGIIDYRRGRVSVLDRAGLEKIVCECYGALQQDVQQLLDDAGPQASPNP